MALLDPMTSPTKALCHKGFDVSDVSDVFVALYPSLCFSDKMIVCSSVEAGWIALSPVGGDPITNDGVRPADATINFFFFFERSK